MIKLSLNIHLKKPAKSFAGFFYFTKTCNNAYLADESILFLTLENKHLGKKIRKTLVSIKHLHYVIRLTYFIYFLCVNLILK